MAVVAFVIGVLVLVVGLAVSIALHEIGHLVPAKRFGVRVSQYMVGFGPTLWSRKRGETEYGIKALPIGGYISMAGMYPQSQPGRAGGGFFSTMVQEAREANDETLVGVGSDGVFYRLPVYKRIIIMLGGPLMNLLLAVLLMTVLLSGFGVYTATATIGSVSPCIPAAGAECTDSDPVSPAAAAGILPGDTVLSVAGQHVSEFDEAAALIQASPGQPLQLVVERDGSHQTLTVTPAETEAGTGIIGVSSRSERVARPIWAGAAATGQYIGAVAGVIWQMPVKVYQAAETLFTGTERDPNGPLSIVGAGAIAGEVAASDAPILDRVAFMLQLLASLNIALFVFNMVPLLPLDGGHIAVALWEGLKRGWAKLLRRPPPRPVDATKLVPLTFVVVIALIVMGGALIITDVFNPMRLLG